MNNEIILIDNDKIIHAGWSYRAVKAGKTISTFLTIEDFLKVKDKFDTNSYIYIDSDLGNGIKGESESKKIFDFGFINIILVTGYSDLPIEKYPWIQSVSGKKPPF